MSAVDLHVRDLGGTGGPVWFSHAIGCDHRMWEDVAPGLAPRFRVLLADARGHGASPLPPRPWTLEDMADDAARALDRLGIERTHWVGLSMGGMVGQAFALRHPGRLDKLVLANTTAGYGAGGPAAWTERMRLIEQGGLAAIRDMVEQRYFSEAFRRDRRDVVDRVMGRFMEIPAQGYLGGCDAIKPLDYLGRLGEIKAPTLVIAGEVDLGTPVAMHEALAKGIAGAKLVVLPGAAHLSAAEMPGRFADEVLRFLP